MKLIEIVAALRHLCLSAKVRPENIKITIEFTNPYDQHNAEYAFMRDTGLTLFYDQVQSITEGQPFIFMGFNAQVKRYEYPRLTYLDCQCPICRERRGEK